jgi:toxin ParE1/3/4
MRLIVSDEAEADLRAIIRFTTNQWGAERAQSYVGSLRDRMVLLLDYPELGPACDDISAGLRRYPFVSHNIFYRLRRNEVRIVRVLHRRMSPEAHLG